MTTEATHADFIATNDSLAVAPGTLARFLAYARDAAEWGGTPLVGGNVGGDLADTGFIMNMKKLDLVATFTDRRCVFIEFTAAGRALAKSHGVDI